MTSGIDRFFQTAAQVASLCNRLSSMAAPHVYLAPSARREVRLGSAFQTSLPRAFTARSQRAQAADKLALIAAGTEHKHTVLLEYW